jgi:hypothetical protein
MAPRPASTKRRVGRYSSLINMSHYQLGGEGAEQADIVVVPCHGRCRISLILSEVMSGGTPYDMYLRQAQSEAPGRLRHSHVCS